jgi:hypothetical protein
LDLIACVRAARSVHQLPPSVVSGDEGVVVSLALAAAFGGHGLVRPWTVARREETQITLMAMGDVRQLRAVLDLASPFAQEPIRAIRELPPVTPKNGMRQRFEVRLCPTINRTRASELDVFLAAVERNGTVPPREQVYVAWLKERIRGARVLHARMTSFTIASAFRPTHRGERRWVERRYPDVTLNGALIVEDANVFAETLRQGVGRQRGYGRGWVWTETSP